MTAGMVLRRDIRGLRARCSRRSAVPHHGVASLRIPPRFALRTHGLPLATESGQLPWLVYPVCARAHATPGNGVVLGLTGLPSVWGESRMSGSCKSECCRRAYRRRVGSLTALSHTEGG